MARQFFNLAEVMGQVDQSRVRDQQIKANEFAMQSQQREMQRQSRLDSEADAKKSAYKNVFKNENGVLSISPEGLGGLAEVDPMEAYGIQSKMAEQQNSAEKVKRENQLGDIDLITKQGTLARDTIAAATPQDWQQRKQFLISKGIKSAENLPDIFDPNAQKSYVMTGDKFLESLKPKAPTTRTVRMGNDTVTQQFNDQTGQFEEVGRGSAFAPDKFMSTNGEQQYSTKPLPTASLKIQNEALEKLSIAGNTNVQLDKVLGQINDGKLKLGLVSNLVGQARNFTGNSSESSRNLSSFKSTLEKLRNDSLRLNKGVQTDGDAQRAWNELFENINDEGVVKQRLEEIKQINTRATELQKMEVENIRSNYNAAPIDFSRYEAKSNVGNGNILPKDAAMPTKPKVGVIDGGYVFLGGDPANPKSWKKAK